MNDMLIKNWNDTVRPSDTVYHIGDFGMGDKSLIPIIFEKLNGEKHLILGNHDMRHNGVEVLKQVLQCQWKSVQKELNITVDGVKLYLRHEPDMKFQPNNVAEFHLVGHVHNSWNRQGAILNVGVDVNDYKPVTIAQLQAMQEVKGASHRGY